MYASAQNIIPGKDRIQKKEVRIQNIEDFISEIVVILLLAPVFCISEL